MTYPSLATASAVRLTDGRFRLSGCSIANVEYFEEADENQFSIKLVEVVLVREPTIKTIQIVFDNGDQLKLNIAMTTFHDGMQETR